MMASLGSSPTSSCSLSTSPIMTQTMNDLLTCPVCLENFRQPKTLNCLHSFCTTCLENCRSSYQSNTFRREIQCPVCKKRTQLTPTGISGLPNDFRIQQFIDILQQGHVSPPSSPSSTMFDMTDISPEKTCDVCKSQQKHENASFHCQQCSMFFCSSCQDRHNSNHLFKSHHIVDLNADDASEDLFCKQHPDQSVKYVCKICSLTMCTICTMSHDPDHYPFALDRDIIQKCQLDLQDNLKTLKSKLSEVRSRAKYMQTVRQTYQKALFRCQSAITQKTNEMINQLRLKEHELLEDVKSRMDTKIQSLGLETLGEMDFHKANIESLYSEVETAIHGSPQQWLIAYDELITKIKSVSEKHLPPLQKQKVNSVVKFVPSDDPLEIVLGQIREICIDDGDSYEDSNGSHSENSCAKMVISPKMTRSSMQRTSSILQALSPGRKNEVKIGKVKSINFDKMKCKKSINADDLISSTMAGSECESSSPSSSSATSNESLVLPSGVMENLYFEKAQLLFKIDQVGGWPGKIYQPSGVSFLPDGCVIIGEGNNRLQVFEQNGNSLKIIGWGKVRPNGIIVAADGKILVSDQKDKCVKVFNTEGDLVNCWGNGIFGMPAGIAVTPSGKIVVADVDKHVVSIHAHDGAFLSQFGSWGSGDHQLNSPTYIAVSKDEEIFVSDSINGFIKIFNHSGRFIRKFSISNHSHMPIRRPQGICIDVLNNLLIADRDAHRILVFTIDGTFCRYLVDKADGVRYPCDIKTSLDGRLVITESHSGFLSKEPHHAIKLFSIHKPQNG